MTTKTYKLMDGGSITADSIHDFVTKLRESSKFDSEGSNEEYIKGFAERYKIQTGNTVKTDSEDNFFEDLLKTGFME